MGRLEVLYGTAGLVPSQGDRENCGKGRREGGRRDSGCAACGRSVDAFAGPGYMRLPAGPTTGIEQINYYYSRHEQIDCYAHVGMRHGR